MKTQMLKLLLLLSFSMTMGWGLGMYYFDDQFDNSIHLCDNDSEITDDTCFDALVHSLTFFLQEYPSSVDISLTEQEIAWAFASVEALCGESVIHLPSRAPPAIG